MALPDLPDSRASETSQRHPNPLRGRVARNGDTPASNGNVANIITVVRILLAPVFVWLLLDDAGRLGPIRYIAAALFILAIATDGVDGLLARRQNLVTDSGKILDPIADKVLTGGALVSLSILGELWWWVTILILVREIGITVFRFAIIHTRVVPASRGGKLKTVFQAVAISLYLVPTWLLVGDWMHWVNHVVMAIALVLTVVTGIQYLVNAITRSRSIGDWAGRSVTGQVDRWPGRPFGGRAGPSVTGQSAPIGSAGLSALLIAELMERGLTIAVAESLTGGLLVAELIRTPGASSVVLGGVVAYNTELKHTVLGVDAALLAEQGPVHPEVVIQMARGVRSVLAVGGVPADVGVATTGVAGPEPQSGHAPGTAFIGISTTEDEFSVRVTLIGDRQQIRDGVVYESLVQLGKLWGIG